MSIDSVVSASAPGKIILTGEHSVVLGKPAYAVAVGLRAKISLEITSSNVWRFKSNKIEKIVQYTAQDKTAVMRNETINVYDGLIKSAFAISEKYSLHSLSGLDITINSNIPMGAGLGSSAAVSVAFTKAFTKLHKLDLPDIEISDLAFISEQVIHGTPSGIDNLISAKGGMLRFQNGDFEFYPVSDNLKLLIVNTEVERSTKVLVSKVKGLYGQFSSIKNIVELMGDLSDQMFHAIQAQNLKELGQLMSINHSLLNSIGVGHPRLDEAYWLSIELGALGAKLTGAGGGGCLIVLVEDNTISAKISNFLTSKAFEVLQTKFSTEGVK